MWLKLDVGYWHNPTWLNLPWEAPIVFSYLVGEVGLHGGPRKRLSAAHWAPGVVTRVLRLPDVDGAQRAILALQEAGLLVVDADGLGVHNLRQHLGGFGRYDLTTADWKRVRAEVIEERGAICTYCDRNCFDDPTVDHIVPVTRGGALLDKNNLAVSCRACNASKGNRRPEEMPHA